nr:LLM class flavin-dependent oxidoreductase [Gracilibacillus sp. YIM 98692]
MEFGIYSLGEMHSHPLSKSQTTFDKRIQDIIEMARYADQQGLDLFGVGEHHRLDYAVSSPQMMLSAIAQITKRIKLTGLTNVLNTSDPVRVFEDYATLDLISNGRAEITAGRGAFVESFPLFGYNEQHYDDLFQEHLELLLELNQKSRVSWSGHHRPSIRNADISPRPVQSKIPISIGVGGTIESAQRAGELGCRLAVIMIGGVVKRYENLVQTYQGSFQGDKPFLSIAGHTFIRETNAEIEREFYPYYAQYWKHLTSQGIGGAMGAARTDIGFITSKESTLFVGTPEQIIEKIHYQQELFGHQRFLAQVDFGGQPLEEVKKTIHLLANKVMPHFNI